MKKILRVTIKKTRTKERCHYEYPKEWDAGKIHVLAYEDDPDNLGEVEEDCLCVMDVIMAKKLLKNPRVKRVSKAQATSFGRKWRPSIAKITNELKVIQFAKKLLSKPSLRQALCQYFSQEELDSLDATKPVSGIAKGKEFNIEEFI